MTTPSGFQVYKSDSSAKGWNGAEGSGNTIYPDSGGGYSGYSQCVRTTSWDNFEAQFLWEGTDDRSGEYAAFIFRRTGLTSYYALTIEFKSSGNTVFRLKDSDYNNSNTTNQIASYSVITGATATVKVNVQNTVIKIYVNGTLRIDTTDNTHSTGQIGFQSGPNSEYTDDFHDVSISEVVPPSVEGGFVCAA